MRRSNGSHSGSVEAELSRICFRFIVVISFPSPAAGDPAKLKRKGSSLASKEQFLEARVSQARSPDSCCRYRGFGFAIGPWADEPIGGLFVDLVHRRTRFEMRKLPLITAVVSALWALPAFAEDGAIASKPTLTLAQVWGVYRTWLPL